VLPVVVAGLLLSGCGGGGGSTRTAQDVADRLEKKVPSITRTVAITEDNDPNDSIGRPGSYEEAVSIYDSRVECESELDITCGAKVERFPSAAGAKKRRDYIQNVVMETSGLLTEYDYLDGTVLLRVSGELEPSAAEAYEKAFS
jgi:hypothetical protein